MAGIGFELKKIYRKEGIARAVAGGIYSSVVTIGPTVVVIVTLLFLYLVLNMMKVSFMTRELLSSTILYVFIFSIILTAPFNAVFSRYLADKFYMDEYANILPSFYTGILILGILGTGISIPVMLSLYFRGGIDLPFILAAYVFWMSSVLLFFSVTYLHATKDYKIIAIFFLVGMLVVVLTALVFRFVLRADRIHSILYGMAAGFLTIAVLEFSYIKRYFRTVSQNYTECLWYLVHHGKIWLTQLLYMLGLYVHNFIFWTTQQRLTVAQTYHSHQSYNMASCLAMFTNISTMILFTVVAETRFHEAYQDYMESIIGGTYKAIQKNKKIMFRTLSQQIGQVFGMQLAITSVIFLVLLIFGPYIGFSGMIMEIYPVLAVSYLGIFLLYGNLVYLYYFDDTKGTLLSALAYFAGTVLGTLVSKNLPVAFYGMGAFFGMLCGFTASYFRIRYLEKNFEAHIFCHYKIIDTMKSSQKGRIVYQKQA